MNNKIELFFSGDKKKSLANGYIWNSIAGILNAGQSVIILMVLARATTTYDAGVFSIAYATASLSLAIGCYGMRSFQVTDTNELYSFSDYLSSRIITSGIMIMAVLMYVLYGYCFLDYDIQKVSVIFVICMLKVIDSIEDVFHGMYQNHGRLDIGAKALTIRQAFTIGLLCILLGTTNNLLVSSSITLVLSILVSSYLIKVTLPNFADERITINYKNTYKLLVSSFGVFLAGFLSLYIVNAPKYVVDNLLSYEKQVYYTYISMPVFVIGLISTFLYQPILVKLADDWKQNKKRQFINRVLRQNLVIVILTVITLVGGYFIGIPALSLIYAVDLSMYKDELLSLLFGGGLLAVAGFLTVIITIIRRQKDLIWAYIIVSVFICIIAPMLTLKYEVLGAAWAYTISILILDVIFIIITVYHLNKSYKL